MVTQSDPAAWAALPDDVAEIERGRVAQGNLFREQPDDSRAARLRRILGNVEGVVTADQLPNASK